LIFFLIFAPSVKLRKKGKFPIVSIVTKNNIKEFMIIAVMLVGISYIFMAIMWYREKMNSQYVNRIIRACKLDVSLYEEVEADKSATLQAASVVVLSSLAAGVGAISLGASNFLMAPLLSLVSWYIWAYLIYLIGAKLFPEPTTKSDHGELLRTIGFSSAPGLIRVFGFTPELMSITFIGAGIWMLVAMIIAVRQALDYQSTWRAIGVVVIGFLVQAIFLIMILRIFGPS